MSRSTPGGTGQVPSKKAVCSPRWLDLMGVGVLSLEPMLWEAQGEQEVWDESFDKQRLFMDSHRLGWSYAVPKSALSTGHRAHLLSNQWA